MCLVNCKLWLVNIPNFRMIQDSTVNYWTAEFSADEVSQLYDIFETLILIMHFSSGAGDESKILHFYRIKKIALHCICNN